jgi:hypothetical protein
MALREFYNPSNLYDDRSGAALAGTSGGQFQQYAGTGGVGVSKTFSVPANSEIISLLSNSAMIGVARVRDAATNNLQIRLVVRVGAGVSYLSIVGEYYVKTIETASVWRYLLTHPISFPDVMLDTDGVFSGNVLEIDYTRLSGTATLDVDFQHFVTAPAVLLRQIRHDAPVHRIIYRTLDRRAYSISTAGGVALSGGVETVVYDNHVEMSPNKLNVITSYIDPDVPSGSIRQDYDTLITDTLTYNKIIVRPRWLLT